jgi:hypothetical protein
MPHLRKAVRGIVEIGTIKEGTISAEIMKNENFYLATFRSIILLPALLLVTQIVGQTRTLTGKLIDEQLRPIYEARIFNVDTTLLMKSDTNGIFTITIPAETKTLLISSLATEWKRIDLTTVCKNELTTK